MTLNPPQGHRERARRGMGCVYACCFAGAQGMVQSHGRLVHIGPGAMGAVTTKTAKCTISPTYFDFAYLHFDDRYDIEPATVTP